MKLIKTERVTRIIKLVNSIHFDEPGDEARLEYIKPLMVIEIMDTGGDKRKLESQAFSIIQSALDLAKRDLFHQADIYLKVSGIIIDTIKMEDR